MLEFNTWAIVFVITIVTLLIIVAAVGMCFASVLSLRMSE